MEDISHSENFKDGGYQSMIQQMHCEGVENQTVDDLSINIGGPGPGQMSREEIENSLEQIYKQLEEKRKEDIKLVEEVCIEIMAQAKRSCNIIEHQMFLMHERRTTELNEEAQKLVNILENIKRAERELEASRDSLQCLCQEIQKSIV